MKKVLLMLMLCIGTNSFSQGLPPPALEPTAENKELIVELMKVTNYENYFVTYCMKRIEKIGAEKGLSEEKILKFKNKINFDQFMRYTVLNQFAIYSKEELQEMITLCKKLNTGHKNYSDVFFTTEALQSNLELQIGVYMSE